MRVQIITATAPATGGSQPGIQFAASYLINDSLAIDAGAIGWIENIKAQRAITDVLISHPHLDHVASLPMFLENVYGAEPEGVRLWVGEHTERALRNHCFNGVMWPDLTSLSPDSAKHLQFRRLREQESARVQDFTVTPIALDHIGPTWGFLVDDGSAAFALVSDTGESDAVWDTLNAAPRLNAVFLECSFPSRMHWLADVSKHLTPISFARQCGRLQRETRVIAVHIKAAFFSETAAELQNLEIPNVEIGEPGRLYEW